MPRLLSILGCVLLASCAVFVKKEPTKGDTHFETGNFCEATKHYNEQLRREAPDALLVARRDTAARRCAMNALEWGRSSLSQNQTQRALETYDAFYAETEGEGVPSDLLQSIRHGYEEAQGRFLFHAKDSPDRMKLVHAMAGRLRSEVVKRWFDPYQRETAEVHAALGRKVENTQPARAVLQYRLSDRLGGSARVTKRLWSKATQRVVPPVNWKPFTHCVKEAKAVTEQLTNTVGEQTAQGILDFTVCEGIEERFKEEIEVSMRPDGPRAPRPVPKEAWVNIKPNGLADFDPMAFADCVGQDIDSVPTATCSFAPHFRHNKNQTSMTFRNLGRHTVPWTDLVDMPVALPGESLVQKRVDRTRSGFQLSGTIKLQFGDVKEHRTLHVQMVDVGRPGEVAQGEVKRDEVETRATERLREMMSQLLPANFLPAARNEENAGKFDEAEEAYLAYSLSTGELKHETIDYLTRRYGLPSEAVSALFHFRPQ